MDDVDSLSNAKSKDCFDKLVILFRNKWADVEEATIPYERIEFWFNVRLNRFNRGAAEGFVMNNNGLEATNRVFKDECTFHDRMPILEFLPAVREWMSKVSNRRDPSNPNAVKFAMIAPDLDTKDMTDGYELVKLKVKFIKFKDHSIAVRNNKLSGKEFDIDIAKYLYEKYRESTYVSLSDYQSFQKDVYIITPDRRCNCYTFGRQFKCPNETYLI